jgi:hypothetical protein
MSALTPEATLREAATAFHKIVGSCAASRLLGREGHGLPQPMHDHLVGNQLSSDQVEKIAADGFELCVRALAELGAPDAAIHECGERDFEEHW